MGGGSYSQPQLGVTQRKDSPSLKAGEALSYLSLPASAGAKGAHPSPPLQGSCIFKRLVKRDPTRGYTEGCLGCP